jgi:hypothetical protein
MVILFIILGGAAGGGLGWLFDRVTKRKAGEAAASCETNT